MADFPMSDRWATELIAHVVPLSGARAALLTQRDAVGAILYRTNMLMGAALASTFARVKAAYTLLDDAFSQDAAAMAQAADVAFDRLGELQQRETDLFAKAWNADKRNLEEHFGSLFALYDMTYERFYRTLAGPYVVADALLRTGQSAETFMDAQGRVGPQRLAAVEAARGLTAGVFSEGVDSHLRNAAAHHQYDILGVDSVRVWDQDQRSRQVTWGPHEWTHWQTRENVFRLSNTAHVLLLGLAMFDIAHGRLIQARFRQHKKPRRRRRDVIEAELNTSAQLHGFVVLSVDEQGADGLHVKLRVDGRTELAQERQIITGGGRGPGARYVQRVETRYAPLARQVLGLVQMSMDSHIAFPFLRVTVVDSDGKTPRGEITISEERRFDLLGEATWEQALEAIGQHSIHDVKIPVVLEFPVKRVE